MAPRRFPAVFALTVPGKLLCFLLRGLTSFLKPLYGKRPMPGFEENPAHYRFKDLLYFSYKYYLAPPEESENPSLNRSFREAVFDFEPASPVQQSITLSSGGDLMPYAWMNAESCKELWDNCGPWFFDADIVFANLETPIHTQKPLSAVPEVMLSHMYFNGSESLFRIFNGNGAFRGFDVLSTANNHSLDMDREGISATLEFLKDRGIVPTGTHASPSEQFDIPVVERNGIRVAFVAATYCLNYLELPETEKWRINTGRFNLPDADLSLLRDLVREAGKKADFTVLSLHNGNAYQAYPSAHTVENVHRIFRECGPDLILGSHPHNPQPLEQVHYTCPFSGKNKKGIAVYSQGDFVAYDIFT